MAKIDKTNSVSILQIQNSIYIKEYTDRKKTESRIVIWLSIIFGFFVIAMVTFAFLVIEAFFVCLVCSVLSAVALGLHISEYVRFLGRIEYLLKYYDKYEVCYGHIVNVEKYDMLHGKKKDNDKSDYAEQYKATFTFNYDKKRYEESFLCMKYGDHYTGNKYLTDYNELENKIVCALLDKENGLIYPIELVSENDIYIRNDINKK